MARLLRGLYIIEAAICVICLTAVTAAILSDVIGRELIGASIFGSQRFAVLANAVVGLLGFSIVVGTGGHLRPNLVDKLGPPHWAPTLDRVADLVSAAICGVLGGFACVFVHETYRFGETMMSLPYPLWPVQVALPYMFFSAALRYVIFAARPALRPVEPEPAV